MRRVRQTPAPDQTVVPQQLAMPLDDGAAMLAMIQALWS
jgi:hypothetical protein